VNLKAVFFDAGNTLISIDYAQIAQVLRGEGFAVASETVWEAECRARVRLDPILVRIAEKESPEVFTTYMRLTCEELGIAWGERPERALERLREINRRESLWRGAAEGAKEVLSALDAHGCIVGVISNSDGRIEKLLKEAGLSDGLDLIIDSRIVGVEKPDPRIFRLAIERASVEPAEAVYVGDFYSLDVLGARSAGIQAILLDPVAAWPPLDCIKAKDLLEVRSLLLRSPSVRDVL
jgi:putative hydrolase of the HAD superfamily